MRLGLNFQQLIEIPNASLSNNRRMNLLFNLLNFIKLIFFSIKLSSRSFDFDIFLDEFCVQNKYKKFIFF